MLAHQLVQHLQDTAPGNGAVLIRIAGQDIPVTGAHVEAHPDHHTPVVIINLKTTT